MAAMSDDKEDGLHFAGEEIGAGYASPVLDLVAAGFLIVLSVTVMIASLALPMPGGIRTAPGLLPFLTAASLLAMALFLGATALRRHRAGETPAPGAARDRSESVRTVVLVVMIGVYIGALQVLAFQLPLTIGGVYFNLTAFEPATIIALSVIIQFFWRGPLWITTGISLGWTLFLSVVFQKVFVIPLPGGF
ncbi:MAG: hypothetical protein D6754_05205 [Alphaproteobacteria bacterium]|nr:MAG: hypothetical protein D6754_05205 [Alphaproteobacteria bacterium]